MPITLADFQQGVASLIQDAAQKLKPADIQACISEAITGRYSQARPVQWIADFTGDGVTWNWTINLTNFPGWVEGFSVISDVEYPADDSVAGEHEPNVLDKEQWMKYATATNTFQLRLLEIVPAAGKKVRVRYTLPHAADGSDTPVQDFNGVVNLAAALACRKLAAVYAQLGDQQFGGDAVDYKSRTQQYLTLANQYDKAFQVAFGLDQTQPQPAASSHIEWRQDLEAGGRRLIH